ncbi:MAG: SUMF1/EgtB/PvdO family nonheme iron enzyme [Verrucomicrobiales bacterium]|nr:SUMF1/EgtB/PvdO family nonheme iron enzyme [Verrucomicrobiales bacterium]
MLHPLHPPAVPAAAQSHVHLVLAIGFLLAGTPATQGGGPLTADSFGQGENAFTLPFVTIGDPGNPDDPFFTSTPGGLGGVGYVYRIAKYETADGIVNQANVAGDLGITTSDPAYTPPSWGPNKPATHMTWYEAARFVNWLNTSTGHHPAYRFDDQGVWQLWSPAEAWQWDGENLYRHKAAFYFLPSADEWHKAAYYDGSRYWRFPTGSDSRPQPVSGGTEPGTAVYGQPYEAGPADVDNAGGLSPYGTMGQGGNMWEWNESALDGTNDSTTEYIQIRGGRWISGFTALRANGTDPYSPWGGRNDSTSFRVAARVPLPVLPNQALTTAEDTTTAITLGPAEADGFVLTYEVLEPPAHGTLVVAGPVAHYSPDRDFHGEDRFSFRVSDGELSSEPAHVVIDILPVDDPPTLSPISDQVLLGRPAQGTVAFTVADVDTPLDALVLSASARDPVLLPAAGLVLGGEGSERTLQLTAAPGLSGETLVTITVSDGHAQTSTSFRVSVPATAGQAPPLMLRFSSLEEGVDLWLLSRADEDYLVEEGSAVEGPYRRLTVVSGTGDWVRLRVNQTQAEPMRFFLVTGFVRPPASTLGDESGPEGN